MQEKEINEKELYQEPEFEIVRYSNDDIIATSGIPGGTEAGIVDNVDDFETGAETGY